jgi:hypothetical protein
VWLQKPISEYQKKCISSCQKALAWSIGGSKADLLELKVAAGAVATSGLESEVQCIPQKMHELRSFPVPDHTNVLQNRFLAWCAVGACRARCCALSLALAPGPSHWRIARVDSTRASQLKLRTKATEPDQKPLIQIMIEFFNAKGGILFQSGCQGIQADVVDHFTGAFTRSAWHQQTCFQAGST